MRKRERERIERRREQLQTAKRNAETAIQTLSRSRDPKRRSTLRREALRSINAVREARGKLELALRAPVRNKQRDLATRPQRYRNPTAAELRLEAQEDRVEREVQQIEIDRMKGREGRAQTLARQALKNGEKPEDVYKTIASATGLSEQAVFTILVYLDLTIDEG